MNFNDLKNKLRDSRVWPQLSCMFSFGFNLQWFCWTEANEDDSEIQRHDVLVPPPGRRQVRDEGEED